MAYQGGTKLISVRIDDDLYALLQAGKLPKGTQVNNALWALKHDWEFNRLKESEKRLLTRIYYGPVVSAFSSTHTKMRIANMYIEWAHLNQIIVNRAINMAIKKYVGDSVAPVVTDEPGKDAHQDDRPANVTTLPGKNPADYNMTHHYNDPVVTIYMNRAQLANIEAHGFHLQKVIDIAANALRSGVTRDVEPLELLNRLRGVKSTLYEPLTDTIPVNIREPRELYTWACSVQHFRMSTFYYYAIKNLLELIDKFGDKITDKYDLEL